MLTVPEGMHNDGSLTHGGKIVQGKAAHDVMELGGERSDWQTSEVGLAIALTSNQTHTERTSALCDVMLPRHFGPEDAESCIF